LQQLKYQLHSSENLLNIQQFNLPHFRLLRSQINSQLPENLIDTFYQLRE